MSGSLPAKKLLRQTGQAQPLALTGESCLSDLLPRLIPGPRLNAGSQEGSPVGDRNQTFQQEGGPSQTKIYGPDRPNEREKEEKDACSAMPRDQDCCPITKNVVALDSAN